MLCRSVRQILAGSSDRPALLANEEVRAHLEVCPDCRREEFYYKQLSDVRELVFPYEVSSNFNYKLEVKLANRPRLSILKISPGVRHRLGWYFSMGTTGALAVLALYIVNRNGSQPVPTASLGPETPAPVAQTYTLPIPLFTETVQASERPKMRLKLESPLAAQFASASSEPLQPGVDGDEKEGWEEAWVWVGDSENGFFIPVRRYRQSSVGSEPVLLLPAASTNQSVNIVY